MPISNGSQNPNNIPSKSQPLPPSLQHKYEAEFGASLSHVTLHESHVPTLMGDESYTRGSEIHFPPGSLNPHSEAGQNLLGHELAHVVQNGGNPSGNGSIIKSLAEAADDVASRIARAIGD